VNGVISSDEYSFLQRRRKQLPRAQAGFSADLSIAGGHEADESCEQAAGLATEP
jgi:hypothetical protein